MSPSRGRAPSLQQSPLVGLSQDPGFNPSDTYARIEFSVDRSYDLRFPSGMVDATGATRLTAHVQRPTEHFRLEAGYDAAGDPRYVIARLDKPGDPTRALVDPATVTVLTPRGMKVYGANGIPLADWTNSATVTRAPVGSTATAGATSSAGTAPSGALSTSALASLGLTRSSNVLEGLTDAAPSSRVITPGAASTRTAGPSGVVQTHIALGDGGTMVRRFVANSDGTSRLDQVDVAEAHPAYGGLGYVR